MTAVLVDWLGRGGIAQCTETWAIELARAGRDPVVVTRPGRALSDSGVRTETFAGDAGRVRSHARVAARAAEVIRAERPDVVVVQNYVIPALERPVYRAIGDVGARLVLVVHDHRLHTLSAGTRVGLRRAVRGADSVIAHTQFVGTAVARWAGRDVDVIPHPLQVAMVAHEGEGWPFVPPPEGRVALHFGVLRRRYKGTDVLLSLAERGVPGWELALIGTGAPPARHGVHCHDGFVPDDVLVRAVRASAAVLLPYRHASQSGAVVLAQALGAVVVASAVGGIPEQIADGSTGLLIEPGAPVERWAAALDRLADEDERTRMARAARASVSEQHERFRASILELVP